MDSFEAAGARFDLSAAEGALAQAQQPGLRPVLAGPGKELALLLGTVDGQIRIEGRVTTREPGFDGPLHQFMIGTDYVAPVFEALGRLFEGESRTGEPTTTATGIEVRTVTGRPLLDGRVTDRLLATVASGSLTAQGLRDVLDLLVALGIRRTGNERFLQGKAFRIADSVAPAKDDVRLDDLGGLDAVVSQLRDVADSFRHPEVMARWGARRPQGILMWGPPGTGKTTLARALANEIGGTLREIRSNEILDRWMGASERNIAKVFAEARGYREPTVLLFDEFDSIVSYAGRPQGSADQAINSVAGIFKQEMNTLIEANPQVIVVATTNFPDRVDESLIRSGRFDIKLAVPLPGRAARADILTKQLDALRRHHPTFQLLAEDISVAELAERAAGLSGADLAEVLRRAQLEKAMTEARGGQAGPITQADLLHAISRLSGAQT
ncbi:ATP-binding protein [Kineosporia babensis]|uniref:ATP-binding protein n=1 Tax=Kineosporia babensis TaxID=499548 RepID=A0A9X1NFC0_9ACTN|nr:ATP-binding protein [Kineosporia babensis]MCD5312766.1 ATP-binding protein [Kineosporia babensis]